MADYGTGMALDFRLRKAERLPRRWGAVMVGLLPHFSVTYPTYPTWFAAGWTSGGEVVLSQTGRY